MENMCVCMYVYVSFVWSSCGYHDLFYLSIRIPLIQFALVKMLAPEGA